jgi:branched-chain amino acid transport system substrate-binding protein
MAIVILTGLLACRAPAKAYVIGVVLGGEGEHAARLALARVNAAGGINGRPLEIRTVSGRWSTGAQQALIAAESLAADPRVLAVIGHANSSASLAGSQVYNERHVVQIAPTTTAPLYDRAGPYSFRLVPSDTYQARFLAETARAQVGGRVAVFYVNDDYGRSLHALMISALAEKGVRPVFDGGYVEGDTTNGAPDLITGLEQAKPNLLVWIGRAPEFMRVSSRLHEKLPALEVLASDGFGGPPLEGDSTGRFDRVRYVRLVNVATTDTMFASVRAEYRKLGLGEISDQAALSFDAVMLLVAAIREVGADRERIRSWLFGLGRDRPAYLGITGPVAFPRPGDPASHYYLVTAGTRRRASADH